MILRLVGLVALSVFVVLVLPSPRVEAADDSTHVLPSLTNYDTQNLRWLAHHHPSLYRQLRHCPGLKTGSPNWNGTL